MNFHNRLRQLRSTSGMTVQSISDKTGIPISSYRHLEYGRIPKDIDVYEKLSTLFNVSLSYLMFGNESLSDEIISDLEDLKEKVRRIRTK